MLAKIPDYNMRNIVIYNRLERTILESNEFVSLLLNEVKISNVELSFSSLIYNTCKCKLSKVHVY